MVLMTSSTPLVRRLLVELMLVVRYDSHPSPAVSSGHHHSDASTPVSHCFEAF